MNKSASLSIKEIVAQAISTYLKPNPFILIGISGGVDSIALLYTLQKIGIKALGVHINYGLRGKESDLDQELCEGLCFQWGFECSSVKLDSKEIGNQNFQNWARNQRYQIFRDLKKVHNADAILTAHHKDDQIETILQKLFRGSGATSWQGIKTWDGELLRPLLEVNKKGILDYCAVNAIPYRNDESNFESKYARNFLRNEFTTGLDKFFPGWQENVMALRELGKVTGQAIDVILSNLCTESSIDAEELKRFPKELRISILNQFVKKKGNREQISKGVLNELNVLLDAQVGKKLKISDNIYALKERDRIVLLKKEDSAKLNVDLGKDELKEGVDLDFFSLEISHKVLSSNELQLDTEKLVWPIAIRNWKSGDRFIPLGMAGSQKISDHLINKKIPSSEKENTLILSGVDGTIYAIIYPVQTTNGKHGSISDLAKYAKDTKEFLTLKFKP